jgi:hypothetical protein
MGRMASTWLSRRRVPRPVPGAGGVSCRIGDGCGLDSLSTRSPVMVVIELRRRALKSSEIALEQFATTDLARGPDRQLRDDMEVDGLLGPHES